MERLIRTWPLIALAGIVALATWLRLHEAGESLWLDELHTAWCVEGSLSDVAPRAAIGNQSPLYFYIEWFIARIFGTSEWSLRGLSLLCGIALPVALFGVVRSWSETDELSDDAQQRNASSLAALVAAVLATFDPFSIFYSQEARPYALVQLVAVGHVFTFARMLKKPSPVRRTIWVTAGTLHFYLHYTAALVFLAEVVAYALSRLMNRKDSVHSVSRMVLDISVLAVFCLPAVGHLLAIFARRENWEAFVHPQPLATVVTLLPWSGAGLFVLAAMLTGGKRLEDLIALCWLFVPLVAAWLLTVTDIARLFFERYLISSAAAAFVLAGFCIRLAPTKLGRLLVALAFVTAAIATSGITEQLRYDGRVHALRREDWRGAVDYLNSQLTEQPLPVLVRSGLIEADALPISDDPQLPAYCLYPVTSLYPLAAPQSDLIPLPTNRAGMLAPDVQRTIHNRRSAWLIFRASKDSASRIAKELKTSLGGKGQPVNIEAGRWFGDIWVARLDM